MSARLFSKFLLSQKVIMPSGELSQSFLQALQGHTSSSFTIFQCCSFCKRRNLLLFLLVFTHTSQEPVQTALNLPCNRAEPWHLYQSIYLGKVTVLQTKPATAKIRSEMSFKRNTEQYVCL